METIVISAELKKTLLERVSPVSIVGDDGVEIGTFVPKSTVTDEIPDDWPSEAELDAREKNLGRLYTTAEVLAHLRTLG